MKISREVRNITGEFYTTVWIIRKLHWRVTLRDYIKAYVILNSSGNIWKSQIICLLLTMKTLLLATYVELNYFSVIIDYFVVKRCVFYVFIFLKNPIYKTH